MVTIHRFNPMTIYKGGGYPLASAEITDWDNDLSKAVKAFDGFSLKSISADELEEMNDSNLFAGGAESVWVLAEIQSATIPMSEYKRYLKNTADIEIVGYACDYDFKTEREKSMMPNGKKVSKKIYQSIFGSQTEPQ